MSIDDFLVRFILFTFPGLIWLIIYETLNGRKKERDFLDAIASIFISSLCSYFIYECFLSIVPNTIINFLGLNGKTFTLFLNILDSDIKMFFDFKSFFILSVIAIILAYLATFVKGKRVINRIASYLNLTKKDGSESVWDLFNNENSGWMVIRDNANGLVYYGYISRYSEQSSIHELVLTDVSVYTKYGDFLYECKHKYISRDETSIEIEIFEFNVEVNDEKSE